MTKISINIGSLPIIAPFNRGEVSTVSKHFRGTVVEKTESGKNFYTYKVADRYNPEEVFKVLSSKSEYLSLDSMTFDEMHEDVQVGDYVSVFGLAARSLKGSFYIRANGILVREYGDNQYEDVTDDPEEEDSDADYIPSDVEDTDDDEDEDDEEVDEDEDEEVDEEVVKETYQPTAEELNGRNFTLPMIPLTVYHEFIVYQGKSFAIDWLQADQPFRMTLITAIGKFHICKQDRGFIGVYVPGTNLEKEHLPHGYDMILPGKYRDLLRVLC